MFKHDLKLKMAILFIVFLESWLLGALRFDWNFASFLYGVLNIPFGTIFLYADHWLWFNYEHSHWLNDELFSLLTFGGSVICQAVLYYYLFKAISNHIAWKSPQTL